MKTSYDLAVMEQRRYQAIALLRKGLHQAEIARRLKVSRMSVSRWVKAYQRGGKPALVSFGRRGPPFRLSLAQRKQLLRLLAQGAQAFGYFTDLWTASRIAEVIRKHFKVSYHRDHVSRILRACGWSYQKPTGRALERSEQMIKQWLVHQWPRIKKKPAD